MKLSVVFLIVNILLNQHVSYLRKFCLVPPLPFDENKCNINKKY